MAINQFNDMNMSSEYDEDSELKEQTVIGQRHQSSSGGGGYSSWGGGNYTPFKFDRGAIEEGNSGAAAATQVNIPLPQLDSSYKIPGINLHIKVSADDMSKISADKQAVIYEIIKNMDRAPELYKALKYYEAKKVSEIVFKVDDHFEYSNGSRGEFKDLVPPGQDAMAAAIHDSNVNNPDRTDIIPNTPITIWFNVNQLPHANTTYFARTITHELMHPYAPDLLQADNTRSDHDYVYEVANNEHGLLFNDKAPPPVYNFYYVGFSITGSDASETYMGGSGNDIIAGMFGNDTLDGGGGTNALYGGRGQDVLTASGYNDFLSGGLDADTYNVANEANVTDSGGVDHIALNGYIGDFSFRRDGSDLYIHHLNYFVDFVSVIQGHFSNTGRVEIFQFYDGEYSASHIESILYSPGGDTGPYGEEPHVSPIIIDLNGNGIDIGSSTIQLDASGDGVTDSISWIANGDGVLVIDRDQNRLVSDISEICFINDFRGAASDAEGLLYFDINDDGFINQKDSTFGMFYVWYDINNDGTYDNSEISSLSEMNIINISLEVQDRIPINKSNSESQILGNIDIQRGDGVITGYDVALSFIESQINFSYNLDVKSSLHSGVYDTLFIC